METPSQPQVPQAEQGQVNDPLKAQYMAETQDRYMTEAQTKENTAFPDFNRGQELRDIGSQAATAVGVQFDTHEPAFREVAEQDADSELRQQADGALTARRSDHIAADEDIQKGNKDAAFWSDQARVHMENAVNSKKAAKLREADPDAPYSPERGSDVIHEVVKQRTPGGGEKLVLQERKTEPADFLAEAKMSEEAAGQSQGYKTRSEARASLASMKAGSAFDRAEAENPTTARGQVEKIEAEAAREFQQTTESEKK